LRNAGNFGKIGGGVGHSASSIVMNIWSGLPHIFSETTAGSIAAI
jgi:hypothetical protein